MRKNARSRRNGALVWAAAFALSLNARSALCQTSDEPDPVGASGLWADLVRIVDAEERAGWFVDEPKLASATPILLESLCRASPRAHAEVAARVAQELLQTPDPKTLVRPDGGLTPQGRDALRVHRRALLWKHAEQRIAECPFYIKRKPGFRSRQTDLGHFTLNLESGGLVQTRLSEQTFTYGGGGVLRALAGYGFGTLSTLAGIDVSGGAMLVPKVTPSRLTINYFPSVPLVVRVRRAGWHYDGEVAAVALLQADNARRSYGARLGFSVGFSALRTRNLLPWAGFSVAAEHYVPSGGREAAWFFRGGLRVGAAWDPFVDDDE